MEFHHMIAINKILNDFIKENGKHRKLQEIPRGAVQN